MISEADCCARNRGTAYVSRRDRGVDPVLAGSRASGSSTIVRDGWPPRPCRQVLELPARATPPVPTRCASSRTCGSSARPPDRHRPPHASCARRTPRPAPSLTSVSCQLSTAAGSGQLRLQERPSRWIRSSAALGRAPHVSGRRNSGKARGGGRAATAATIASNEQPLLSTLVRRPREERAVTEGALSRISRS